MLIVKDLTVSYGGPPVLRGLSLSLEEGCIHGLVGLNGAGKTTLFHALYGLKKPGEGSLSRDGQPLSPRQMALLETQHYFYPQITGREYLSLFRSPGRFELEVWQELFRLPLDELVEHYSTGMKKKLALTGILKLDKEILLLDEPFNGVDLETARIFTLVLKRLREKKRTVLVTSHILETLTGVCDFIHLLEGGSMRKTYGREEMQHLDTDLFSQLEREISDRIGKAL